MFGKITKQQVAHHFNRAKDFLGNAYNQTRSFLGDVDAGVRTFKQIYGAVAPVLESYGVRGGEQARHESFNGLRHHPRACHGGARQGRE
jgi:hypothetical protein